MDDYIRREDAIQIAWCYVDDRDAIDELNGVPKADVVEVGKWHDMREYILEMQADENGHNEFFRIIKLDDELKERIANKIEETILYGTDMRGDNK